ncbi:MAG: ABC transporter permease [Candidatus Hydrogenedentes bacterium]|nr:ABC transporter permease [Candidatus Hydrogenedentota bacterium]
MTKLSPSPVPELPTHSEVIVIRRVGFRAPIDLRELWAGRELFGFLIWRDIRSKYKQTVLGLAWVFLQPILASGIFSVIFGAMAKMPSDGLPYPIFVLAGVLPWTYFMNAVTFASNSLINQPSLLTKIYMPRLMIPGAPVVGGLLDLAIGSLLMVGAMLYFGVVPNWTIVFLPALVLLTALLAVGVGSALCALTVAYRDFRYVIPFMLQVWFYLTPVVYSATLVEPRYRWVLAINPLAGLVDAYRASLLGRPWDFTTLSVSAGVTLVVLAAGVRVFKSLERRLADLA